MIYFSDFSRVEPKEKNTGTWNFELERKSGEDIERNEFIGESANTFI